MTSSQVKDLWSTLLLFARQWFIINPWLAKMWDEYTDMISTSYTKMIIQLSNPIHNWFRVLLILLVLTDFIWLEEGRYLLCYMYNILVCQWHCMYRFISVISANTCILACNQFSSSTISRQYIVMSLINI